MYLIHLLLLFTYLNTTPERFYLNITLDNLPEVSSCTKVLSSEEYLDIRKSILEVLKESYNVVEVDIIKEDCERSTI